VFNQLGDLERCALRSGNVHSAAGWRVLLEPVVVRYRGVVKRLYFRGDAAFANPAMYEFLEAEGIGYSHIDYIGEYAVQLALHAPEILGDERADAALMW
jgi:Transposase DDE domain group 1